MATTEIVHDFINYYLFDYEISVYPEYTKLDNEMINKKMNDFSEMLFAKHTDMIHYIVAYFYNEKGEGGRWYGFSKSKNGIITLDEINKLTSQNPSHPKILTLPYYLFKNTKLDILLRDQKFQKKTGNDKLGLFQVYKEYERLKSDFIWRSPFQLDIIENSIEQLETNSDNFKEINGCGEPYQKLYSLIAFKEDKFPDENKFQLFADSFALVIKEWGLDILRKETLRHGTKASLAAIISRNHSHHIGSHVMTRSSVEEIRARLKLNKNHDLETIGILKNGLDEYIQKKADFVAEITTEPLTTTKNLKFFDEIILKFLNNTLLTDNIGKTEGVTYNDDLENNRMNIEFYVNEKLLMCEYCCPTVGCPTKQKLPYSTFCHCNERLHQSKINPDDITIAVPGCLGEFAFFAFLENFIRNGIKHNKHELDNNKAGDYTIYIKVTDKDQDFYCVKIYDNVSDPCKKLAIINNNGVEEQKSLHEYIRQCIENPIINDDGSLKKESWGIAELKIMATLLKGSTDFFNMSGNLQVGTEVISGKNRLVYTLYVMKPKEVAIVSNTLLDKKELEKEGIWLYETAKEYEEQMCSDKGCSNAQYTAYEGKENIIVQQSEYRISNKEYRITKLKSNTNSL